MQCRRRSWPLAEPWRVVARPQQTRSLVTGCFPNGIGETKWNGPFPGKGGAVPFWRSKLFRGDDPGSRFNVSGPFPKAHEGSISERKTGGARTSVRGGPFQNVSQPRRGNPEPPGRTVPHDRSEAGGALLEGQSERRRCLPEGLAQDAAVRRGPGNRSRTSVAVNLLGTRDTPSRLGPRPASSRQSRAGRRIRLLQEAASNRCEPRCWPNLGAATRARGAVDHAVPPTHASRVSASRICSGRSTGRRLTRSTNTCTKCPCAAAMSWPARKIPTS